ncbi:unnamed protein product [Closterium sp. Yama58-4]|nr:unnamed protein product [Closterium sp. Yama58-4]
MESWEITPSISALYELAEDHRWKAAVGASAKDSSHDMDGNAVRSAEGFKAFDAGDEPVGGVGGGYPFGDDNDDGSVVDFGGGGDDGWNDDGCGFAGPPFAGDGAPGMIPVGDSDGENGYSDVDDGMDTADWLAAGMGMTRLKGSNAWAGPKHWHFVKSKEEPPAAAAETKGRKKRAAKSELIDFSDPRIDESLFQAPKALKEIQLTKAGRKVVNTLLPKDYHYDGRKLATVFISSDWSFLARKARSRGGAKQGFEDGGGGDGFAAVGGGEDVFEDAWGGDECADPFDYGDDFDGQGDSAEVKPVDNFMEDLVPMPKKAQKIDVNYARQSKQVDVKILKDTIWVELQRRHAYEREKQQDEDESSSGPISFDRVLHNFPANCRAAALSDISSAYDGGSAGRQHSWPSEAVHATAEEGARNVRSQSSPGPPRALVPLGHLLLLLLPRISANAPIRARTQIRGSSPRVWVISCASSAAPSVPHAGDVQFLARPQPRAGRLHAL